MLRPSPDPCDAGAAPSDAPLPERVARHYDLLDPYYRALWGEHLHHGLWERGDESIPEATGALLRRVAEEAGIARGSSVVDVGSGYGATARWLAETLGARVTAVTLSPVQHARAEASRHVEPAPEYLLGDFLGCELPAGSYDAALAVESLSHMDDLEGALAEVRRVLRPGGRFVACVWLAGDDVGRWRRRALLEPIVREGRLARLAPAATYRAALARCGLALESFEDLTTRVRRTWWICARRVAGRLLRDGEARRLVLAGREGTFAWSVARLALAYRVGAMRYGLFAARAPDATGTGAA
ncbi:MAG: methyltransferase domain-containing protein [Gemmatimonadota bacterium]|jgi:tocopherol O-methyltransferase